MGDSTGVIFDIRRYSIHDGPGIRTTVFLKGCPLYCLWCHNPESQSLALQLIYRQPRCIRCGACIEACAESAVYMGDTIVLTDLDKCTLCGACLDVCQAEARQIVGREMTLSQVMEEVRRDIAFYDESGGGVTISGGEPLLQSAFLSDLLRACKAEEIHTALDTCGFASWESLDGLREFVDLFLYDLKIMDDDRHVQLTGVSNRQILNNLNALSQLGHNIILRVPLIPGVNDDEASLRQLGDYAARLPHLIQVDVLPYHHTGVEKYGRLNKNYLLSEVLPPTEEKMVKIARILREYQLKVSTGG